MTPERKKEINNQLIEEFYWRGEWVVYVENQLVNVSFAQACELAEKDNSGLTESL